VNPAFAQRYGDFERWHWWFRGRRRIIAAVLRRELDAAGVRRIVSLGCGPATDLAWLSSFVVPGGSVVGVDADPSHARSTPTGVVLAVGRIERVPLRPGAADAVLALDVLEHVEDDAGALREARRLLHPGGVLIVTVPALPSLWGAQDEVNEHRRRYTRATLRGAFARADLPAPRLTYFNALLLPPIAAVRWARRGRQTRHAARSDFEDNRPGLANDLLAAVFAAERHVVPRVALPLGVSLLATARAA